jgi:glycosyltransferase involved in cell wall biosynthesis
VSLPAVGLLHYTCPPVVGGVETILWEQARRLRARGYAVTIVAGRGGPLPDPDGIRLTLIPELDSKHPEVLAGGEQLAAGIVDDQFTHLCDRIGAQLETALAGLNVVLAHNVLTLHFNLPLTAALWQRAQQAPRIVSWCHDLSWANPLYRPRLHEGKPWDLLRRANPRIATVCVSEQRRQEWSRLTGQPEDSARVIPNGIDPSAVTGVSPAAQAIAERLGLWECDAVLLAPVRITRRKNLEWAVRAAAAVRACGRTVRLVVSGPPGPHDPHSIRYLDELRRLREELHLNAEVHFLFEELPAESERSYPVDTATLAGLYMLSDVVVLPSRSEGFGLPVAEAGLHRVPVVCSDLPVFRELGREDVRYVSLDAGPGAFGAAVLEVLEQPATRLRHRVLRELDWNRIIADQLEPLLREA